MKISFDTVVTTVLVICALAVTGLLLRREFFAPAHSPLQGVPRPTFIKDWRADLSKGVPLGDASAPVQIMELGDFECPYCGDFHKTVRIIRGRYPNQIALTYVHFPIPGHRFAIPAARVAECAANQGRFEAMHDQLFEHQEDFGLKPWSEFATAAGVPDPTAFDTCIKSTAPMPRVEEGKALGNKLGIQGTPTVIINGWKLGRPPNAEELEGMVKAILGGKSPVTADEHFAK